MTPNREVPLQEPISAAIATWAPLPFVLITTGEVPDYGSAVVNDEFYIAGKLVGAVKAVSFHADGFIKVTYVAA